MSVNGVKIEVGQTWEMRDGRHQQVMAVKTGEVYPVYLANGDKVRDDGRSQPFGRDDDSDLVALVKIVPLATLDGPLLLPEPRTVFDAKPIDMAAPGYECLANVLQMAYNQAAVGKGVERHAAAGEPFDKQVMQIGAAKFGVGALLFQAFKKSEESQRLPHDRAVNELLGAINYLAGAVIALEKAKVAA